MEAANLHRIERLSDGFEAYMPTNPLAHGTFTWVYPIQGTNGRLVFKFTESEDGLNYIGRVAIEELGADVVLAPRVHARYRVREWTGRVICNEIGTIKVVDAFGERFAEAAKYNIDGPMTPGQAIAFDRFTRALNKRGYAWVDNHDGNFAFYGDAATNQWRVVVVDTGGILPVKGLDPNVAHQLQLAVDRPSDAIYNRYVSGTRFAKARHMIDIAERFDEFIDWDKINRVAGQRFRTLEPTADGIWHSIPPWPAGARNCARSPAYRTTRPRRRTGRCGRSIRWIRRRRAIARGDSPQSTSAITPGSRLCAYRQIAYRMFLTHGLRN